MGTCGTGRGWVGVIYLGQDTQFVSISELQNWPIRARDIELQQQKHKTLETLHTDIRHQGPGLVYHVLGLGWALPGRCPRAQLGLLRADVQGWLVT